MEENSEPDESNAQCDEPKDKPGETPEEMVLRIQRTAVEEFMADPQHKPICENTLASLTAAAPDDIADETIAARQHDAPHSFFE